MSNVVTETSARRKAALTAGTTLFIMAFAAFFSYGYVLSELVVPHDAATTLHNIQSSKMLFKAGIFGWVLILICDVLVAWGFYFFLKPVHQPLSLLGAWFRLIYSAILGVAILCLILVLMVTVHPEVLISFNIEQIQGYVLLLLNTFDYVWSIGLIIFGGHLLIIGYLTYQSRNIPKVISVLLIIASIGYITIHFGYTFLSEANDVITLFEYIFSIPMILGEIGFGLWLLAKGGKHG
ncbi:DUF4386 domain-containing protein [Bacillus carboniphilus]|uniref:DUF4386 domain-containing protein n=1 Tax=Bacillus carboniphilus TaxID=86663 RepID=A0ABY9JUF7_9BACI|nr:DUF4386 domain-containing protein [Bacillus carboniphilus]WLR42062.1 DUF4386 domain-containing protein [Bacillus carboniphilus]